MGWLGDGCGPYAPQDGVEGASPRVLFADTETWTAGLGVTEQYLNQIAHDLWQDGLMCLSADDMDEIFGELAPGFDSEVSDISVGGWLANPPVLNLREGGLGLTLNGVHVEVGGTRPDFTFPLPNGLKLNMDVKFPLANYVHYLDAESDSQRAEYGKAFINDVKGRIKEAATRDYINTAENTVDYALVFIPNEQVYGAIHELDPGVVDTALEKRIVLCSPLTLYAMLAVIRQAAENVRMEQKANEMGKFISEFAKQWEKFKEELTRLGSQIDTVQKTYSRLESTRVNQLEKPIDKIEELRSSRQQDMLEEGTGEGEA